MGRVFQNIPRTDKIHYIYVGQEFNIDIDVSSLIPDDEVPILFDTFYDDAGGGPYTFFLTVKKNYKNFTLPTVYNCKENEKVRYYHYGISELLNAPTNSEWILLPRTFEELAFIAVNKVYNIPDQRNDFQFLVLAKK